MAIQVGDRVKVVQDTFVSAYVGATGVVTSIEGDEDGFSLDGELLWPYTVKFDEPVSLRFGDEDVINTEDAFDEHELEAI